MQEMIPQVIVLSRYENNSIIKAVVHSQID